MGMHWWVANIWSISPTLLIAWVFWVIFSIVLHELGHGYAAIRLGDDTPIYTGHMTWNPLVHMGQTALIMFALFGFTWGAMPVNPSRLRGRYGDAIVAVAGPFVNLCLFVLTMVMNICWISFAHGMSPELHDKVALFLYAGSMINLFGLIFNLIPIPPLDGSRIVGDFFPAFNRLWRSEHGAIIGMIAFGLMFFVGGGMVWQTTMSLTIEILHRGVTAFGGAWDGFSL